MRSIMVSILILMMSLLLRREKIWKELEV